MRGFTIDTSGGAVNSAAVVIATGACGTPHIPAVAADFPAATRHLSPIHYRNPDQVDGPVLVVGASASGAQIADELARAGRDVTLAVSNHVRLPRRYRGMDIHWWLEKTGMLDEHIGDVEDPIKARRSPSLQLVGSPDSRDLGLNELQASGVRMAGRLAGVTDTHVQFSGSLANAMRSADLKQNRFLDRCDEHAAATGLDREIGEIHRPEPTVVPEAPLVTGANSFATVIWATGFRPQYPYLPDHLLDRKGALPHVGGVTAEPGLFILGMNFGTRRNSSFIDGVGRDAVELAASVKTHVGNRQGPTVAAR